jgi:hypothetical protein
MLSEDNLRIETCSSVLNVFIVKILDYYNITMHSLVCNKLNMTLHCLQLLLYTHNHTYILNDSFILYQNIILLDFIKSRIRWLVFLVYFSKFHSTTRHTISVADFG